MEAERSEEDGRGGKRRGWNGVKEDGSEVGSEEDGRRTRSEAKRMEAE
jgi:hypothetical protein